MVTNYLIRNGRLEKVDELGRSKAESVVVYTEPSPEERRVLIEDCGIDPHNLASSLDPDELGRVEVDRRMVSVIMKRPRNFTSEDQLLFTVTSMGVFVLPKRLVIVSTEDFDFSDDKTIHVVSNARDAFLKVMSGNITHFLGHLKVINMLSEALEKRINASMENRYLLDMFTLEKSLVFFVNGIGSNRLVFDKLRLLEARLGLSPAQKETFEDVVIENAQCLKQAEIYSDILTGLMDARGSVVNNNLGVLMKRLTIISVIFMPMNVLAGMGGMSEFSAWTKALPPWVAFPLFLVGLVGVGFLTAWFLRATGLDRPPGYGRHRPDDDLKP